MTSMASQYTKIYYLHISHIKDKIGIVPAPMIIGYINVNSGVKCPHLLGENEPMKTLIPPLKLICFTKTVILCLKPLS